MCSNLCQMEKEHRIIRFCPTLKELTIWAAKTSMWK